MTALLYYSIVSDLTEDGIIKIDKNRETVYLLLRQLPLNSTRRAKRLFVYLQLIMQTFQPIVSNANLILLPPLIHTVSLVNYEQGNENYSPQIAPLIESKMNKIVLTDQQISDLNLTCYQLQTNSISLDTAVSKLRAGGFLDLLILAFFVHMLTR